MAIFKQVAEIFRSILPITIWRETSGAKISVCLIILPFYETYMKPKEPRSADNISADLCKAKAAPKKSKFANIQMTVCTLTIGYIHRL